MTKTREIMIAELGRRHPAAADDIDAILAMPRSDAVNEGLLADKLSKLIIEFGYAHVNKSLLDEVIAALRAVPSPDIVGVRKDAE